MPQWPAPSLMDGALQVSPSQLSLLQRCRRQWGFKYLFNRELATEGVSASAGKAFHAALQARYMAKALTPQVEGAMRDALAKGFEGVEVPLDDYRTLGRYQEALKAYNEHHAQEPFETLAVEMPVVVTIGDVHMPGRFWERMGMRDFHDSLTEGNSGVLRVDMKAIIDRLVRWPDGLVMVADTKTSKDWKASHQVMWERSAAPKAYAYAIQWLAEKHPELGLPRRVHGFMLDSVVIRRSDEQLKRPRKADGPKAHEFQRLLFHFSAEKVEEWRVNALRTVRQALLEWAEGDLGFEESACSNWYGRTCSYIDVCRMDDWHQRRLVLSFDKFKERSNSVFDEKAKVEAEGVED